MTVKDYIILYYINFKKELKKRKRLLKSTVEIRRGKMVDYLIYRDNSINNIIDEKNISKENFQVKRGGGKPRHSYIDQI